MSTNVLPIHLKKVSFQISTATSLTLYSGVAQWVARLTRNVEVVGSSHIKGPRCFLEQETLPLCLVLVGSRNGFERDFTIELE